MADNSRCDASLKPAASPDYLEIARAWLAEHIEGNNWTQPGSTEQRVKPLAELLARVRSAERGDQPEPELDEWNPEEWAACSVPNWDGCGANPIFTETLDNAALLWDLLRRRPDPAPGADGTIGFQWLCGDGGFVIIEVGPNGRLNIRRIPGPSPHEGEDG